MCTFGGLVWYYTIIVNCAAMGQAQFLIYPWFIYLFIFLCWCFYVGVLQTSTLPNCVGTLNHATCDVYLPKAVEILIHEKCYGYWCKIYIFRFYRRVRFEENFK